MNITPFLKGVSIAAALSITELDGFGDPMWWAIMLALNVMANLPDIKV
jgi:hypothetical protein